MEAKINSECIRRLHTVVSDSTSMCEKGGILMGIKTDEKISALEAVVIPSMQENTFSYSLDGKKSNTNRKFIRV